MLYAGCLDEDPYFCLKQCDRIVLSGLKERGLSVSALQNELPKGGCLRPLNRKIFYPALVAKASRFMRHTTSASFLHIGSQCYANLIPFAKGKVTVTCHDLAEHYFPQDLTVFQIKRWKHRMAQLKNADLIFSVSEYTKKDLINILNIPEHKVIINHNGVGREFRVMEESEISEALQNSLGTRLLALGVRGGVRQKSFKILTVGANLYRKNIPTLVKAAEELVSRGVPVTLVKVGDPVPQSLKPNAQRLEIINLGHVSQTELISLYNLCDVLAFPSLYEGFGLPVIEAQCCGLPCVVSSAASLPEIGGKGAIYCAPGNAGFFADTLEQVYRDENLRNDLREKGFNNAKRFSWDKHVDTLIDGYEHIAGEQYQYTRNSI